MIEQMGFCEETDFRDTSVGRIPKEWTVVSLGDVCDLRNEMFQPTGRKGYRFVGLEHISSGAIRAHAYSQNVTVKSSKFRFFAEDILYGKLRPYLDKAALVDFEGVCSTDLLVLKTKETIPNEFLVYVLHSKRFLKHAISTTSGTNHPRTSWKEISRFKFGLPKTPEQRKIAEILGNVDLAIAKIDAVVAKTERLKKGLMQQLLTRGIGHTEYKDTPIGTIPKTWQIAKLEEVSKEVIIGNVNPATPFYTTAENGVPYFRSQNVRENNLLPTNIYVKKEFNQIHPKSILKENDVLTIQTGFIGTSCLVPKTDGGSNCHSLLIARTNPQLLNPQFLCHFLNSDAGKKIIMKHNAGWGRDHLLLEYFRKADIPIPPLAEQDRIVNILSTIYQKAALERNEKLRLERIKVGLMDLLLTGKVRIKVD